MTKNINPIQIMAKLYGTDKTIPIPSISDTYTYHQCSDGQGKKVPISKGIIKHHVFQYVIYCGYCDKCNTLFYVEPESEVK